MLSSGITVHQGFVIAGTHKHSLLVAQECTMLPDCFQWLVTQCVHMGCLGGTTCTGQQPQGVQGTRANGNSWCRCATYDGASCCGSCCCQ
jgi:hypothetical protein